MIKSFQLPFSLSPTSSARYRVDTAYGYISYGAQDYEKALQAFKDGGIRLRICRDIFDEGRVVAGLPEEKKDDDP